MPRYWVNLGCWEEDIQEIPEGYEESYAQANEEVKKIRGAQYDTYSNAYIYKTGNFGKAKEVYLKWRESLMDDIFRFDNGKEFPLWISISSQPECIDCGRLAPFAAEFCDECETKLIPKNMLISD